MSRISQSGMTLMEVLIALFILSVGLIGVLSAVPIGVRSAQTVIFQDASIHLAQSKLAEFRRDRVDPAIDLVNGSAYLASIQEPENGNAGNWRDFAARVDEPYHYFDGIERYEWRVTIAPVNAGLGSNPPAPANYKQPVALAAGVSEIGVYNVSVSIRMKGRPEEVPFSQYMIAAGK
jgi:prepilin-type N-terminal cleavage/methylation domain-containing protein